MYNCGHTILPYHKPQNEETQQQQPILTEGYGNYGLVTKNKKKFP